MLDYFSENHLIAHDKSGFKPEDSLINQLSYITHDIFQTFDGG